MKTFRRIGLGVIVVLSLAGCGGDEGPGGAVDAGGTGTPEDSGGLSGDAAVVDAGGLSGDAAIVDAGPGVDAGPRMPGDYPYYDMLVAHPNAVLSKAFRTEEEIAGTYIDPSRGAHVPGKWTYDPVLDAARLRWDPNEASLSSGEQLRWGNTPGYTEPTPTSFGTLGTGTFLFVWEWRFDPRWAISARDTTIADVLQNHKAFQAASDGSITIEPRFRYTGGAAQFDRPAGNQVCHLDVRTYVGGNEGVPGGGFPQLDTIFPEPDQWFRLFLFLDGESLEVSYWGQIEGGPIVHMLDRAGGITGVDQFRGIDGFWFELNTSQEGGSGIAEESYGWGRNWVVLAGLSYEEAEGLVGLSSW